ncbi:MAG: ATP-binding cassette domain-containing protein [Dehalococcoidia bacterium]|nr:ATP-binding cassette domain-containing protein [Dehalococcoidia bacterium]
MLTCEGLTRRFGDVVALEGASLTVEPGRMVGFLGPNGSGKTTAMRSIFGLVRLDAGRVLWDGRPVDGSVTRRFGYMPESRGLYPRMPAGEQVAYFATLHGVDRAEARRRANHWLARFGIEERAGSKVETLSHGNQQRVQLAVALAFESDLLVLDEPFAGLDPLAVQVMGEVVREEAARGAGVLFSSHQLDLVEGLCDDVVIIHHGRVVVAGPLEAVRAASPHRYIEVTGEAADGAWYRGIPGAEVVEERRRAVRLRVDAQADPGAILALARGAGQVDGFRFEPPSLSDLFVEAVRR